MSFGRGGGNKKNDNSGEGEGGGSTLGSKGETKCMEGPQQIPHRHQDALPPETPDGEGEESLGAILEGVGGGGTVRGRGVLLFCCFYCLVFFFFVFSFLYFLSLECWHGVWLCLLFLYVLFCSCLCIVQ